MGDGYSWEQFNYELTRVLHRIFMAAAGWVLLCFAGGYVAKELLKRRETQSCQTKP